MRGRRVVGHMQTSIGDFAPRSGGRQGVLPNQCSVDWQQRGDAGAPCVEMGISAWRNFELDSDSEAWEVQNCLCRGLKATSFESTRLPDCVRG